MSPDSATVSQVRLLAFQTDLRDLGNPGQHLAANLIDDLLDASGFKPVEDFVHHAPRLRRDRALGIPGARFGVEPVQVEPHVQRPVVYVGQGGVLVAHKAVECAAAQAQQAEALYAAAKFHRLQGRAGASQFQPGSGNVGAAGSERHVAAGDWLVGNLGGADLRAFHVRVGLQKVAGEKAAVGFQVMAR